MNNDKKQVCSVCRKRQMLSAGNGDYKVKQCLWCGAAEVHWPGGSWRREPVHPPGDVKIASLTAGF
jgi:hypothetical protein